MGQLVRTLRRLVHWSGRVRVRVADTGPVVPTTRHLIEDWLLDQAPDLRPVLQTGQAVEILVLHHTRSCGAAGPVVPALTERLAGLTRIAVGRYRPGPGQWQPVLPAELLTALEVHLQALARGYGPPVIWLPGLDAVVEPAPPGAAVAAPSPPARPARAVEATGTPSHPPPDPLSAEPAPVPADPGAWPDALMLTDGDADATEPATG